MSKLGLRIKRNIAMILVCFLVVGLLPSQVFANDAGFSDINEHWAEGSINKVVQEGLFKGSTESVFEPQGSMTRAMFITVLNRLAEKLDGPEVALKDQTFTDVSANAWYANAIGWAVSAGLTDGYGNGTFGPNDLLNREQITVLMMRFLTSYMGYDLSNYQSSELFADSDQISSWANEAVYQAVALGLIQGETGNLFNPKGTASRAVVAVITERFLEKSAGLKVDQPSETPAPTVTPAPSTAPGDGNGSGGGTSTIKVTTATIQIYNKDVVGKDIRSGDLLTVAVTPTNATKTVKWFVNDKVKSEAATYTVGALDVGAVITAEVTGTGRYSGVVTSAATGTVVASVDLTNKDLDSAPVVVADDVTYVDANGEDITLNDTDIISFSVTASEVEVTEDEQDNVAAALEKEFADVELDIAELDVKYFAIDAKLLVESADKEATEIHPVGKTTLTLSKANLGFKAEDDISTYTFLIGHTNKKGVKENLVGQVIEINGEQYVRVELNGLSTVYIGNIPPLTVTFDTDGGSDVPAKKVKLGEITPAVTAPTKEGYFFIGWYADLNQSPIYMNMTITALWLEGAYVPQERLSLVYSDGIDVEDYSYNANGVIKVALSESIDYGADLKYTLNIEAPHNATNYVLSNSAEAAASGEVKDATAVNGNVEISIDITGADAKVITGNHSSFIKWFDNNDKDIILETVTVSVETDVRAATREQTFAVNRGVGTVEVMLLATSDENENYFSYLNGYLSGSAVYNNYNLSLNASFDRNITGTSEGIDYNNYSGIKLIATPFEGESYYDAAAKASAYYWDANDKRQNITLNSNLNDEGLLEFTTQDDQNLKEMAGTSNYFYLYVTVEVGNRKQQVNVNVHGLANEVDETREHISTDQWAEVVVALAAHENVYINYNGEAVTLNKVLVLKEKQSLYISGPNYTSSDFTIGSGGELRLVGTVNGGANVNVNGEILVSNGGKITTTSQLESQGSYYYTGVSANKGITVEAHGEITVPEIGFLSINGENRIVIKQNGILNVKGRLDISTDTELNGTLNIIGSNGSYSIHNKGTVSIYGDLTINNLLEVSKNGQLSVSGMTTIQENSELRLTKGNINLNGKTYNYGKIAVQEGDLTLSNVGYAVNNDGIIELAANARLTMPGTTLVNNKTISGTGTITLTEDVNAAANYDNGIEYISVEGTSSPSNYSRYQFVNDPEATVTGIIYESKISGTGTVAQQIKVVEIKVPSAE